MFRQARIVGGRETGVNEYPMMAGLVDFNNKWIYCGATVIARRYTLSAAHCVEQRNIIEIGVVVGEHDVTTGM
jgi:secreted trypsin-like serine protease